MRLLTLALAENPPGLVVLDRICSFGAILQVRGVHVRQLELVVGSKAVENVVGRFNRLNREISFGMESNLKQLPNTINSTNHSYCPPNTSTTNFK